MAEPAVATPGSTAESGTPAKHPATKDRPCPYCNARFTSSSLGRHLDLYIKEKNPKPPDGIHDVEQIRRTRGNVTRRQARTSSAKREDSTASSAKPTPMHDQHQRSPSIGRQYTNGDHPRRELVHTRLNTANWQATGVINDIPPTPRDEQPRYELRRDPTRRISSKNELAQRQKAMEDRDRGRAAELALREVLDSVKAAKYAPFRYTSYIAVGTNPTLRCSSRSHPQSPFDFDFFSQSFPALCLRCLSTPPAILASHPIFNNLSWPTKPPGAIQQDNLRQWLDGKLQAWRGLASVPRKTSVGEIHEQNGDIEPDLDWEEKDRAYQEHLTNAFKYWDELPEIQKQDIWQLESLRAYAREREQHKETRSRLERIEQETQNLRAQVDRLSRFQQPREFLLFPPTTIPISHEAARLMPGLGTDRSWDYDQLLSKWKSRIQHQRSMQRSLPPTDFSNPPTSSQHHHLNGASSHHTQNLNGDSHSYLQDSSDDDLIDAPGDEDEDMHLNEGRTAMDRGMLDPKLRDEGVDEVMQGIEGDGEESLLVGLRGFTNLNKNRGGGGCNLP
ncbi:hypothetical protein MMC24_001333 [Lignoscripta atroalba]|nr:hypothetical protein [Lignoscripta atroalba]